MKNETLLNYLNEHFLFDWYELSRSFANKLNESRHANDENLKTIDEKIKTIRIEVENNLIDHVSKEVLIINSDFLELGYQKEKKRRETKVGDSYIHKVFIIIPKFRKNGLKFGIV